MTSRVAVCACVAALCLTWLWPIATATRASAEKTLPYAPIANSLSLSEAPLRSITGDALPRAGTAYVDGVSDQSLPSWDGSFSGGSFAGFFQDTWSGGLSSHITLARYVVQWNVMSGDYPAYLSGLDAWYADVLDLGLTPEVSLASYDGVLPGSPAEYQTGLEQLLDRFPAIRYLEAWDEPNDTAGLAAGTAARYTDSAYALCETRGCTVIAGNFLDSADMIAYEKDYERALDPADFSDWGIHPYYAVKTRNAATVLDFRSSLPDGGAGERIWFTEIGAYRCEDDDGRYELLGEREQALDASWLVNRLMPAIGPVHVFYYEFLFKDRRSPPCDRSDADTALYVPGGEQDAADSPRAAAGYIYDDRGVPFAYTGSATVTGPDRATLAASVYPGGFQNAAFHFEYGPTASYGSYSSTGNAGSALGGVGVGIAVDGLRAGVTYHYRVVAWNAEGAAYGSDRTFATPAPAAAPG